MALETLKTGYPGITNSFGGVLAETCAICLDDQGHSSGVSLSVNGDVSGEYAVDWGFVITEQMRRCYRDSEFTTEHGAYAIAFLVVSNLTDLTIAERSWKGPGFDYWLGKSNGGLFQDKTRLEVSGLRAGTIQQVNTRVNQKLRQVTPSDAIAPAYIVVVEFSQPMSKVVMKCQK